MKIRPLGDRILVKAEEPKEKKIGGIIIPETAKEKPQEAEVIAVGPGGVIDGKEVKMEVKKGDQVIFSKYSGTEVKLDEEGYPFNTEEEHGIGTRSVLNFINQTDSEIRYIAEEKTFKVRMLIN